MLVRRNDPAYQSAGLQAGRVLGRLLWLFRALGDLAFRVQGFGSSGFEVPKP